MAVLYKLYKIVRSFKDGRTDKANNHWFARAISLGETSTAQLAKLIEEKCTATHSDVVAVLNALTSVMRNEMQNSKTVRLDGIGTFKIGIKSVGSETPSEFSVTSNITGHHIIFRPEFSRDIASGKSIVALLQGTKVQEAPKNMVVTD